MAKADKHVILGVHITDRVKKAVEVQAILSAYGCNIRTRLGLHDTSANACSPNGLVLLEIVGEPKIAGEITRKLAKVPGVDVQKMVFAH